MRSEIISIPLSRTGQLEADGRRGLIGHMTVYTTSSDQPVKLIVKINPSMKERFFDIIGK